MSLILNMIAAMSHAVPWTDTASPQPLFKVDYEQKNLVLYSVHSTAFEK